MWASISIIFDHSCVNNIIFSLICGIMEVLIGNLSLKSILKNKKLNGLKPEGGNHLRKNHMLIFLNPEESQVLMQFGLVLGSIIHRSMIHIFLEGLRGMHTLFIGISILSAHQFFSVLNGQ
jgi:hypothetical protein